MREKRWLLNAIFGIILANALVSGALKATRPKFKIATTSTTTTTTEEAHLKEEDEQSEGTTTVATETNGTTGHTLTGIPQIDYIWDPNLPRELNGYNLSEYPFYNSIPEDIDFKCDGLHDGFYASVPHKCQVYHHCLFGTRYDFLCANFTAFDQKTFICHFVSEVDCANSKKYWHRNDALYKAATTSTTSTTTTTTLPPPVTAAAARGPRDPPRRRRPFRRRPAYDYYDDEYYDDEYGRPRGYGPRDDYEYEDRKFRRDRDREFRDRDFRYPARNNRRDQPPRSRDPLEEDPPRVREQPPGRPVSREVEDGELEDRRPEAPRREPEDRRYSDKRFRDDYDDKEPSSTESLVKPAAPVPSVYARPRAPPKIRRPVPLSEQDRFAYKATSAQSTEEPRRRPVDIEDDYYEDELEEVRPVRRPLRRRPTYRDRDFYDARERDRDRPFRPRYRGDDEDEPRPSRKHSDRPRDRYYDRDRDRGRDRSLDRGKDRSLDRDRARIPADLDPRPHPRPLDREPDRGRSRAKDTGLDTSEQPRRQNTYERTTNAAPTTTTTTSTTCLPEQLVHRAEPEVTERPERPSRPTSHRSSLEDHEDLGRRTHQDGDSEERRTSSEEYSSEYYDEPVEEPSPPPRTAVRIVKRPFLPSRGGNPNPRGLSPVGSKAPSSRREEGKGYYETSQEHPRSSSQEPRAGGRSEEKQGYDAYKVVQAEVHQQQQQRQQQQRLDEYDTTIARPVVRRPIANERQREEELTESSLSEESSSSRGGHSQEELREDHEEEESKWSTEAPSPGNTSRGKSRYSTTEPPYTYKDDEQQQQQQQQPSGPGGYRAKQKSNEVTHRLQDIPESEYDVTLNDALTPTLNQEASLPSGFVLPLHRQVGRDTVLQSSESSYKLSRPTNSQQHQQQQQQLQLQLQQQQQQQQQQQKPFVPSPQYLANGTPSTDRLRTVYYRTPETIQISGTQYRQTRGPWHDYTGY